MADGPSRAERRRQERAGEFAKKLTTRQDVTDIIQLYHERHVVELWRWYEWYHLPWYKKLWYTVRGWFRRKEKASA